MQMLKDNPNLDTVYLCLDNDSPGQDATKRIRDKLFTMGKKTEILIPINKDWNEDLVQQTISEKEDVPCQIMSFS